MSPQVKSQVNLLLADLDELLCTFAKRVLERRGFSITLARVGAFAHILKPIAFG